jgi:hypothetical protein
LTGVQEFGIGIKIPNGNKPSSLILHPSSFISYFFPFRIINANALCERITNPPERMGHLKGGFRGDFYINYRKFKGLITTNSESRTSQKLNAPIGKRSFCGLIL